MRRAISLIILALVSCALMIFVSAPSASASTGDACHTVRTVKTTGARTVTTETKACTGARGGYTRGTYAQTCTRSHAGNACTSVRDTRKHTVSTKGNVTDTHTVTRCTKAAGKSSVCTTVTDSTSGVDASA